jgi:hypothetical protein
LTSKKAGHPRSPRKKLSLKNLAIHAYVDLDQIHNLTRNGSYLVRQSTVGGGALQPEPPFTSRLGRLRSESIINRFRRTVHIQLMTSSAEELSLAGSFQMFSVGSSAFMMPASLQVI